MQPTPPMRFRTEISIPKARYCISHDTPLVLLGSCFTDEIGRRLEADGFDVTRNPLGPLYNPASIARCIARACRHEHYTAADLTEGPRGRHCLDYASRYSGPDADAVLAAVNADMDRLSAALARKPVVILTLGSAFVYRLTDTGSVVGNCHKFPADRFERVRMSVPEVARCLTDIARHLTYAGVSGLIFTVSPIRHMADGLHGNNLSKATLQLGIGEAAAGEYFPSYEIMLDDLRDYRFYAADMRHPSEVAVEYIYRHFADTYFDRDTRERAAECHRRYLAERHRTILD